MADYHDNDDDDGDNEVHQAYYHSSTDSNEDGFNGTKILGENYNEIKALKDNWTKRQKRKLTRKRIRREEKSSKKAFMYDVDGFGEGEKDAVFQLGLGGSSTQWKNGIEKQQKSKRSMSLEERLNLCKENQSTFVRLWEVKVLL